MTKLKKYNFENSQRLQLRHYSKAQIVTQINKLIILQNLTIQIVTTQQLQLWQNSKTDFVGKPNCEKTQIVRKPKLWEKAKTWIMTNNKQKIVTTQFIKIQKKIKFWHN